MKQNRQLRLILRDLNFSDWKEFPVRKNTVSLPIQLDLFAKDYSKRSHVTMGLFYELLGTCLFGGKLTGQSQIDTGIKDLSIKPDIFCKKKKMIIESKAMRTGHQLLLLDDQIERYKAYQTLYLDYEIYFIIWRHSLRNIKSYSKSLDKLILDLCEKTLCAVIIPFSLIVKIHGNDSFIRYEEEKWAKCTRLNSDFINQAFIDQELFFSRLQVIMNEFETLYYKTPDLAFNKIKIKSFPVVWIKDLNHESWVKKIVDNYIPF